MKTEEAVVRVQSAYPKIYLACHRHHQNAKTTDHALSQRDATILAHLSIQKFASQNELASHLGISKSTLSEAVTWLEECGHGKIPYKVKVAESPSLLMTEIDDPSLPFSGTWTFEIAPILSGSILTITERGEVPNPFFRFMSKYIFSHEKTINTYLSDLEKSVGQSI